MSQTVPQHAAGFDPLTLCFRDPELERGYLRHHAAASRGMFRLLTPLAAALFLAFGLIVDPWFLADMSDDLWIVRLGVLVAMAGFFAASYHPSFVRWFYLISGGFLAFLGAVLLGMLAVSTPEQADIFYVSLLLVLSASFGLAGITFRTSTRLSLVIILLYLAIAVLMLDTWLPRLLVNAYYLASTTLVVGVIGYQLEQRQRIAYLRIRDAEQARRDNEFHACHDNLTGLINRRMLTDHLAQTVGNATQTGRLGALIFLDLVGFKQINDGLGHLAGDDLLKTIASRLRELIGRRGEVARFGGDEFVLLIPDIGSAPAAEELIARIKTETARPIDVKSSTRVSRVRVGVSAGYRLFGVDANDAETLLAEADAAMYEDKQRERRHVPADRRQATPAPPEHGREEDA